MARLLNRYLKLVFTRNENNTQQSLILTSNEIYFTVKVNKYMSHLKDEIVIEIWNLSPEYQSLLKKYDTVSVYTGREKWFYNQSSKKIEKEWIQHLIATQTILVQSNDKNDLSSLKTIIIGSSRFRKSDIKAITLSAGISLKNAINFIVKRSSMKAKVHSSLSNRILQKPLTVQNISNAISSLLRDYSFLQIKNDSKGEDYDIIFDYVDNRADRENIIISPQNRTLIKDWISIDSNGDINFVSLPNRVSFAIGDGISINSKYLNYYVNSSSSYTDKIKLEGRLKKTIQKEAENESIDFEYIIISLDYTLDVKGTWEVRIKARPRTSFNQKVARGGF